MYSSRSAIKNGKSEFRVRALSVFADMIRITDDVNEEDPEKLYHSFDGPNTSRYLTDLVKKPFGDISASAHDVLMAASEYSWGVSSIINVGGFLEYLLDRSAAKDKESKDRKYVLIGSICGQKEASNIVPPELLKQLRTYVKQGAYYVESTVEVAIDEQ